MVIHMSGKVTVTQASPLVFLKNAFLSHVWQNSDWMLYNECAWLSRLDEVISVGWVSTTPAPSATAQVGGPASSYFYFA